MSVRSFGTGEKKWDEDEEEWEQEIESIHCEAETERLSSEIKKKKCLKYQF